MKDNRVFEIGSGPYKRPTSTRMVALYEFKPNSDNRIAAGIRLYGYIDYENKVINKHKYSIRLLSIINNLEDGTE